MDDGLQALNPFRLPGYLPPKAEEESVRTWSVSVAGIDAIWIDCQSARTGGTIGVVAGERIVRAYDSATARRRPVVVTMSGGGTRVEEGALALAQRTRVAAAMGRHRAARLITVAHFGSPVAAEGFASWVPLADVRAAEPGAQLGGLGAAHSSAERAREEGLIDAIVPRERRWHWMADVLGAQPSTVLELPAGRPSAPDTSAVPDDPHQQLLRCQTPSRPSGLEWAAWLTDGWIELRGRQSGVRAGVAWISGHRVVVVATDRCAELASASACSIDGLRLAQRAARLADRWRLPVLTIVDAPPARWASDQDGESGAVHTAHTLLALSEVRSKTVALVVGEAGSTGVAAALTNADRLLMLGGSLFSTAESEQGVTGGPAHGMGARDLVELGVADRVIAADAASAVRDVLVEELNGDDSHARVDRLDFATERVVINLPVRGIGGRGRPATNFPTSSPVVDGVTAS